MPKSIPTKKKTVPKTKSGTNTSSNNAGGRNMIYVVTAVFLIVVLMACFFHRQQFGLKFDKIRYGYAARSGFNREFKTMKGPLSAFGITAGPKSTCTVEAIASYADKRLQCTVEEQPYVVIGQTEALKAYYIGQASKLDTLLKQNGWIENHNTTPTYKQWVQGLTSGKDWYADEGATKNFGSTHCWMDAFLAFSNPQPAAMSLHMGCDAPILQKFKDLPD